MKLRLENLPPALSSQKETLASCILAMDRVAPLRSVLLFGSHARGTAVAGSDIDLCLIADGASRQEETVRRMGAALWDIWPRPAFTLVPITPERLAEKRAAGDHFFQTVLQEGVLLAEED